MVSRLLSTSTAVLIALALTACSSDGDATGPSPSPSDTTTESGSPTPGTLVGTDTFALTLPEGWVEQSDAGVALLLGVSAQTVDGYPMNVNVVLDPTLVPVASEQLGKLRTTILSESGATNIVDRGDYAVDAEPAVRLSYEQVVEDINVNSEEISVSHEEAGYIITFSFAPSVAAAERDDLVVRVMSTWTWAP
jgi:hypothetical protein